MPGREDDAALLDHAHACCSPAESLASAAAHFHEHQRAAGLSHHQVDLAAAAPGRPIIAVHQAQPGFAEMGERAVFGGVAGGLGRQSCGRGLHRKSPLSPSFASALVAAREAAGSQHYPQGALYVVATPIGNLADISLRALHLLALADTVACEDTRHTQALLRAYGIDRPTAQLLALHQHNEAEAAQVLVARLQSGQRIAYASDAGTPAVSDPGARLVAAVQQAGLRVVPIPGASSVTALLSAAGAAEEGGFVFRGFLPAKAGERDAAVQALMAEPRAVVLLEAPHRIEALAGALAVLGERPVTVGRELTKQFEQVVTLPCAGLPGWLAADAQRSRGEFALVLHAVDKAPAADDGERVLKLLLEELPVKTAVRLAAEITGGSRNALYELALRLKKPD